MLTWHTDPVFLFGPAFPPAIPETISANISRSEDR
jgi:hypothetical protein